MELKKIKKGQEEMVGFALIIVVVIIIMVVFLSISIRRTPKEDVFGNGEANSFLESVKQYTTSCEQGYSSNYRVLRELINDCDVGKKCIDGRDSCDILEEDLKDIMKESWDVREGSFFKGYELSILSDDVELIPVIKEGNTTKRYISPSSTIKRSFGGNLEINLKIYK